jgi:hypothetical protein
MNEWLDLLMKGGPWTLVIVLSLVVRKLYDDQRTQSKEHAAISQQLNDRIVSAVEKQIPLLQAANEQRRALVRAINGDKEQP